MSEYMKRKKPCDSPRRQHGIWLTDAQLEELNRIARAINARPSNGTTATWRSMVHLIAEGRVQVFDRNRRVIFMSYKKAPKWWLPDPDGSMPLDVVLKRTKMTEQEAEDRGFEIKGDRIFVPWKAWKAKTPAKQKLKLDPGCPPEWWMPPAGHANSMKTRAAIVASGLKKDDLVAAGFREEGSMLYGLASWEE